MDLITKAGKADAVTLTFIWNRFGASPFVGSYLSTVHEQWVVHLCVLVSWLTWCHLHVSRQGADPPLTSSTRQEDGDDGQQGADGQQSAASRTQHCAGLREHTETIVRLTPCPQLQAALWYTGTFSEAPSVKHPAPVYLVVKDLLPKKVCVLVCLAHVTSQAAPANRLIALSAGKQPFKTKQEGAVPVHYIFT